MYSFDYMYTQQSEAQFVVDNIGEFGLSCVNDNHEEFIVLVKTVEGWTQILTYGPHTIDFEDKDFCFTPRSCIYDVFEFNEKKIYHKISNFINSNKNITQVTVTDVNEAIKNIKPIKEIFTL